MAPVVENKVLTKVDVCANIGGTEVRSSNTRSTFIFERTWFSVAWTHTQWKYYSSKWCGQVSGHPFDCFLPASDLKQLFNLLFLNKIRVSGLENGLLGLNSHVKAVIWSRNVIKLEYMDIICFAHLLFEMCTGSELKLPLPTTDFIQVQLHEYPQVSHKIIPKTKSMKSQTLRMCAPTLEHCMQ